TGEIANDREEPPGFRTRERRGGLVHGDHAGIARQRLADHHEPAIGDGEFRDPGLEGKVHADALGRGAGTGARSLPVYRPKRVALRTPSSMFCRALKWRTRLSS